MFGRSVGTVVRKSAVRDCDVNIDALVQAECRRQRELALQVDQEL